MQRYNGEPLGPNPHIAILFYDAIGDFVVATPLLRGLREKHPNCTLDYYSGERTRELEESCRYIDSRFSVFGAEGGLKECCGHIRQRESEAGPYELAVNCDFHPVLASVASALAPKYVVGRCYQVDLRGELPYAASGVQALQGEVWSSPGFLSQYVGLLQTNFIGEILCRMAFVQTDFQRTEVSVQAPSLDVPDVLIATGGKRSAKLWPARHWQQLVSWCTERGISVGLLGDRPQRQADHYHAGETEGELLRETALRDLRGTMTLPQVAGALQRARACVSIDNGIMHIAVAVGAPTLALFGASSWQLWTPRVPHLRVIEPSDPCGLCQENAFANENCLRDRHVCMGSIEPEMVTGELERLLGRLS